MHPSPAAPRRLIARLSGGAVLNLAIRALTLFLRFALTFYVISMLGLKAAGLFGLAVGAIGIIPAGLGWGLNYFLMRDVVGMSPDRAAPLIVARLRVTFASLALASLVALPLIITGPAETRLIYLLILALLWLETIGLDTYMPLIGLELTTEANIIVLLRSAAWVPVAIGLGLAYSWARTLEAVFALWIAGHALGWIALAWFLRRWPMRRHLAQVGAIEPIGRRFQRAWPIYFSDVGLVGLTFADRFVVNATLGLAATGIYSFYGSITAALATLLSTAVVQVALPNMLRAARAGELAATLRREALKTMGFALVLGFGLFIAVELLVRIVAPGRFPQAPLLLALLLLATALRSLAELLNVAITSTGRDHAYAATNVLGVAITLVASFLCLSHFGLIGGGIAALFTASILLAVRGLYLRQVVLG